MKKIEKRLERLESTVKFIDEWATKDRVVFQKRLAELEKAFCFVRDEDGKLTMIKEPTPAECEHEWEHCIYGSSLGDDDVRPYCRKCKRWRHDKWKKDPPHDVLSFSKKLAKKKAQEEIDEILGNPHDELAERLINKIDELDRDNMVTGGQADELASEARKWMRACIEKTDTQHYEKHPYIDKDELLRRIKTP